LTNRNQTINMKYKGKCQQMSADPYSWRYRHCTAWKSEHNCLHEGNVTWVENRCTTSKCSPPCGVLLDLERSLQNVY